MRSRFTIETFWHLKLQISKQIHHGDFLVYHVAELLNFHALLGHGVAVADRYAAVNKAVVVYRDAERSADGVLTAVALADGVFLVVLIGEIVLEKVYNLLCKLRQAVLLDKRHNCHLDGGEGGGNTHYNALFAVFQLLHRVRVSHDGKAHTVHADGGLYNIRSIGDVLLGIKVLYLLSGELLVVAKVKVGAAVDALKLLETEGEVELDVSSGICVVGKLLVVVETVAGSHAISCGFPSTF